VLKQGPQQPADALIAADVTDPQRVPGAVDRLRTAFPGFIRMTWTSLAQPAAASAEVSRTGDEVRSDADVFADFHRLQRGGPPPAHAADRFAAALSAVRTRDTDGVG
jgi:exonuclease SbcD